LCQHGVPHTLIADNSGGHLMQNGLVDMVITGADRVTRDGDVANKIGTYLKALAARDNGIPMYVALPSSTFDFALTNGVRNIPIEERDAAEVQHVTGKTAQGSIETVRICPQSTPARNWGFDVTPARLITKLISERGVCNATEQGILSLFPEHG
jgi:methylthioribose-1-phosphate isomerase